MEPKNKTKQTKNHELKPPKPRAKIKISLKFLLLLFNQIFCHNDGKVDTIVVSKDYPRSNFDPLGKTRRDLSFPPHDSPTPEAELSRE